MGVVRILRKALKLLVKDERLFLLVTFVVLSPLSLLVLLHYLVAGPLMHKVEDAYETSSLDPKDAWALVGIELPFLISFSLVWLFATSVTIFASDRAYSERSATVRELLVWIMPSTWKKPITTWLYISLLIVAYIVLWFISSQLMTLISTENANLIGVWLIGTLVTITYPYFASIWILALVISVLGDDKYCYGAKAIAEARNLMKGRNTDGFLLTLILVVLSIPVSIVFYLTTADDDDEIGTITRFTFMFIATVLFCLANLFTFVVFTVFYSECKESVHGGSMRIEVGSGYSLVHSVTQDDGILPSP